MDFLNELMRESGERKEAVIKKWGKDKRRKIHNSDKQLFCGGCRQNFYNGNNDIGVSECWSLAKSKLKKRELYLRVDSCDTEKIVTLNCHMRKYR